MTPDSLLWTDKSWSADLTAVSCTVADGIFGDAVTPPARCQDGESIRPTTDTLGLGGVAVLRTVSQPARAIYGVMRDANGHSARHMNLLILEANRFPLTVEAPVLCPYEMATNRRGSRWLFGIRLNVTLDIISFRILTSRSSLS